MTTVNKKRKQEKALACWSLTVACNHAELPSVDRMKSILSEFATQWIFQSELGEQKGKPHYQGRLKLTEPQYKASLLAIFGCRFEDMKDVTFLPESNNSIAQGGLAFYCMKDLTREGGPWTDPTYTPKRISLYNFEDLECMAVPRPFQSTILDMVAQPPDDRTIHWIYEETGNVGKSKFLKYLRSRPEFDMARIPMGTATQIKTSTIAKGPHKIYCVDLPRVRGSLETQHDLFSALEEVKNGWVESAMYGKNQELIMLPPHVFIFSNDLPKLSLTSADRWRIWTINALFELVRHYF